MGSLTGISERLITSHHENNYAGAVRNPNRCEQELSQITADTPGFVVVALRERELNFRNSKSLHEAYFENLGGDGLRSGAIETALAEAYGTPRAGRSTFVRPAAASAVEAGGRSSRTSSTPERCAPRRQPTTRSRSRPASRCS